MVFGVEILHSKTDWKAGFLFVCFFILSFSLHCLYSHLSLKLAFLERCTLYRKLVDNQRTAQINSRFSVFWEMYESWIELVKTSFIFESRSCCPLNCKIRDVNLSNMSLLIVLQYKTIKSQEGVTVNVCWTSTKLTVI